MRAMLVYAGLVMACAAPLAQAQSRVECSASVYDDALGDVSVSLPVDARSGVSGNLSVYWTPERQDGDATGDFGRPGLMLDYRFDDSGRLIGPALAHVMVSKSSGIGASASTPLSSLKVRVEIAGAPAIEWAQTSAEQGTRRLAEALRGRGSTNLRVAVMDRTGKEVAHASFDLSSPAKAAEMARQAGAEAEVSAAAFRAALGRGERPGVC